MAKKDERKIRIWKIDKAFIIVTLGVLICGVVSLFWTGSSKPIESVADQFKAQPGWELVHNQIEGPKNWCGDLVCPSVNRQWKTSHTLSQEEFKSVLVKSGWDFPINESCLPNKNFFGEHITLCSAKGRLGKYRVSVSISASNPPSKSWIGLNVEEEK